MTPRFCTLFHLGAAGTGHIDVGLDPVPETRPDRIGLPRIHHVERHFTSEELVRDIVSGGLIPLAPSMPTSSPTAPVHSAPLTAPIGGVADAAAYLIARLFSPPGA